MRDRSEGSFNFRTLEHASLSFGRYLKPFQIAFVGHAVEHNLNDRPFSTANFEEDEEVIFGL